MLLSTANVPGSEERKQCLRHGMHASNIMFGSATFFTTPNHADTYSPLMLLLHNGPARDDHLNIDAPQQDAGMPDEKFAFDIRSEAPSMPSLHRMHQIAAGNPRGPKLASTFSCRRCTSVVYTGSTSCTSAESTYLSLLGSILVTTASLPSCSRRSPQQQQMWKSLARPKGEASLMATAKATAASASQSPGSETCFGQRLLPSICE